MTAHLDRAQILSRFEALLDSALAAEPPPAGIDAEILSAAIEGGNKADERLCDSYALWAAMTALTQEVKLQGRAFQDLTLTLGAQPEKIAAELRVVYAERERTLQRDAERRCRREILTSLIDLRDRLERGRELVRAREASIALAAQPGWWARMSGKPTPDPVMEAIIALVRGYELGVERLDQTLAEFHAREIRCLGESFDPRLMNAIESQESSDVATGVVLEVYRSGYEWSGEIFRPAQVKVSRARTIPEQEI